MPIGYVRNKSLTRNLFTLPHSGNTNSLPSTLPSPLTVLLGRAFGQRSSSFWSISLPSPSVPKPIFRVTVTAQFLPFLHYHLTKLKASQDGVKILHLLDRTSLNWGDRGRLRSTKVNRAFGMTSFLNLKTFSGTLFQQENGWQNLQVQKLRRVSIFKYRCKSRGRHLLLVSIVVFPLHLGLAPVAKVVVECLTSETQKVVRN